MKYKLRNVASVGFAKRKCRQSRCQQLCQFRSGSKGWAKEDFLFFGDYLLALSPGINRYPSIIEKSFDQFQFEHENW